jgi:hypothetical protein
MAGLLDALLDPQFRQDTLRGLLDAGNRGAVAGLLGGPVDLATMAMRPFGYGVEKPFGGSEWIGQKMQDAGFVSANRNPVAEALASFAGPMAVQQAGPKLFAAEQAMARNAAMPSPMNAATRGQAGAVVWHGSPHKFDKFDSSKIGTGEGAQAYGHGLYLAEAPAVAKEYAGALSAAKANKPVGNVDLTQAYQNMPTDVPDSLLAARRDFRALKDMGELLPADRRDFLAAVKDNIAAAQGGALYKVDLPDESIAKFLDWDKPLSQQPQLLKALEREYSPEWLAMFKDKPGSALYKSLSGGEGAEDMRMAGSAALRGIGTPGIRYLDGGSRGAGQGSSNFVVFPGEESLLTILERNGQPLR